MRLLPWGALIVLSGLYWWNVAHEGSPVIRDPDRLLLVSASGYQTVSMLDGGRTGLYYDAAEDLLRGRIDIEHVVLLGLGGGEMLKAAHRAQPQARLTGVEIDEATLKLAREEFAPWPPGTLLVHDDARDWVRTAHTGSVDALFIDIYNDSFMPLWVESPEFLGDCARVLAPGGLIAMNITSDVALNAVAQRLLSLGFSPVKMQPYGMNYVLFAAR